MDYVPLVDPVLTIVQKLETIVNKYYERGDIREDNGYQLLRLKRQYDVAASILGRLQRISSPDFVNLAGLSLYESALQQDVTKLTAWEELIKNAKRTSRVKRMKTILDQCEATVKEFLQFAGDKISPMLQSQPSQSQAQSLQQDVYTPFYAAPVNPPRLILEYNANHTCEGKLKAAVLKETDNRVVAVIASGKGGVGKTCALRGLACDAEVRQRFSGGILYIELGKDAAVPSVLEAIATVVERTGGKTVTKDIKAAKSLQEAADRACVWFNAQSCLCLVDDIWRVNGVDRDVLTILGSMMNVNSRLVYTTRDTHFLSRADEVIEFMEKDPCGELSRRMLMRHGGFCEDTQLDEKSKDAFEGILDVCQGLPLAFGIAGGSVLEMSRWKGEHERQEAWSDFYHDMCSKPETFFEGSAEQYGRLSKIVDVSLQVLEKQHVYEEYSKWFRSFCVLEKQQSVPDHMLQKLWNMEKLESAQQAVRTFAEVSLVQVEQKSSTEGYTLYVRLHDLVLDLAERKALEKSERKRIFQTLCLNYISSGKRSDPEHEWWNMADDGYIHDNLCRILENAGYVDEVLRVLSKPQWIAKRLVDDGIYSVEQDVRCGEAIADDRIHGNLNRKEHLEQVRKAARRIYAIVANNPREVWFQLHGRLLWHATKCELTKRFIEEIEACAPRPWVKGSLGLLQPPGALVEIIRSPGTVRRIRVEADEVWFFWGGEPFANDMGVICHKSATGVCKTRRFEHGDLGTVRCCAFLHDGNSVVTAHEDLDVVIWDKETGKKKQSINFVGNGVSDVDYFIDVSSDGRRVASATSNHIVRIWDTMSGEALTPPLVGHTDRVLSVAVSVDGTRLVSGSRDETVRLWDLHSGEELTPPLVVHTSDVSCVAVSTDGKHVVSGSVDKTVLVWDAESGKAVTSPLKHTDVVRCVAVSADGARVVSGSTDKTVRVWDTHSGDALSPPLASHTGDVLCVAVSADGKRIVSGSWDRSARVWEAHGGNALTPPLVGHTDVIRCVAVSEDGMRIASGSLQKTVRVWDAHTGEELTPPLVGHTKEVGCVALSADGELVVSGSDDKTVRVWNARSGEALTAPFVGHDGAVSCVAVSADGMHIVSGSHDWTVRVWEVHSGDAVGRPLLHGGSVMRVGTDAHGENIVSVDNGGLQRLWDLEGGKILLTSQHQMWRSVLGAFTLSWSPSSDWYEWYLQYPRDQHDTQVRDRELVLATCDEPVRRLGAGDVYFSHSFRSCRIVRWCYQG